MTFTPKPFRDDGRASLKDWWSILLFVILTLCMGYLFDLYIMKPREAAYIANEKAMKEAHDLAIANNEATPAPLPRPLVIAQDTARVTLQNAHVAASISPKRARLDDVSLKNYYTTIEKTEDVHLLTPNGADHPLYSETGWTADGDAVALPGADTVWTLSPGATDSQAIFTWRNPQGVLFTRTVTLDDRYLFTVTDHVTNGSGATVKLWPYALLNQHGLPPDAVTGIVHEGAIGYIGDQYTAYSYRAWKDLVGAPMSIDAKTGWIGITSRYFFTGLIPDQQEDTIFRTAYRAVSNTADPYAQPRYQVDLQGAPRELAPGGETTFVTKVFVGPKILRLLEAYEKDLHLTHFDLAVDFGWFYFLTKPFYYALVYLNDFIGNFGVAILVLTAMLRLAVFPLANTSFRSFAKMKKVQPQIQELQKTYLHDKKKMQEELVKLYTKEKVNPLSGCLPVLAQIPIFFAMYKVISVAIEMRHASFGWIKDLTAPDPTSILNLYGLLPYDVHSFFHFGVWPSVLFVLIMIQVRLSPPPQDKMMFIFFNYYYPVVVCFVMSKFAAGLVIYWSFSAFLSIVQQIVIMRSVGAEVHLFERIKKKKPVVPVTEEP